MGTEVASRPTLPTGASPSFTGSGPRRRRERETSSLSLRPTSAGSQGKTGKRIYSRDCHLRIQRQKYSLATSIVCIGAKIHQRYSPSVGDERIRDHIFYRENTNSTGRLQEASFISDPTYTQSRDNASRSHNPSPRNFPNSQDYKSRYRPIQLEDIPYDSAGRYEDVNQTVEGCHELRLRLAEFEGELDDSLSFPPSGAPVGYTGSQDKYIDQCDGYVNISTQTYFRIKHQQMHPS